MLDTVLHRRSSADRSTETSSRFSILLCHTPNRTKPGCLTARRLVLPPPPSSLCKGPINLTAGPSAALHLKRKATLRSVRAWQARFAIEIRPCCQTNWPALSLLNSAHSNAEQALECLMNFRTSGMALHLHPQRGEGRGGPAWLGTARSAGPAARKGVATGHLHY